MFKSIFDITYIIQLGLITDDSFSFDKMLKNLSKKFDSLTDFSEYIEKSGYLTEENIDVFLSNNNQVNSLRAKLIVNCFHQIASYSIYKWAATSIYIFFNHITENKYCL